MDDPKDIIKVMLFEDHPALRESLGHLVRSMPNMELCGAYPDCTSATNWVALHHPDVVLMDIDLPGLSGIEGTRQIKAQFPEVDILMVTVYEDENRIFEALCAGASGYLLKKAPISEIVEAIQVVKEGGAPMSPSIARKVLKFFQLSSAQAQPQPQPEYDLTTRESEILGWLVKGHSYKMISDECDVSINTIRAHLKKIYRKVHVHSMSEAVAKAIRENLV
jgi:DNA-binding NarL/FixJ family response regulator